MPVCTIVVLERGKVRGVLVTSMEPKAVIWPILLGFSPTSGVGSTAFIAIDHLSKFQAQKIRRYHRSLLQTQKYISRMPPLLSSKVLNHCCFNPLSIFFPCTEAVKIYFKSLIDTKRLKKSGKYADKCFKQRRRNRLLRVSSTCIHDSIIVVN